MLHDMAHRSSTTKIQRAAYTGFQAGNDVDEPNRPDHEKYEKVSSVVLHGFARQSGKTALRRRDMGQR